MRNLRKAKAFTLIELLVVVAIIGLLIAILIPSLAAVKSRANRVKCLVNLHSMAQADQIYAAEYGVVSRDAGPSITLPNGMSVSVHNIFFLFAFQSSAGAQPSVAIKGTVAGYANEDFDSEWSAFYKSLKYAHCPAFPDDDHVINYVVNAFNPADPTKGFFGGFMPLKAIVRPADIINFTEANRLMSTTNLGSYDLSVGGHIKPNLWPNGDNMNPTALGGKGAAGQSFGRINSDDRHKNFITASFYDGHTEERKQSSIKMHDFVNSPKWDYLGP